MIPLEQGETAVIIAGSDYAFLRIQVWSDPDGDRIYDQGLGKFLDWELEGAMPVDTAGPIKSNIDDGSDGDHFYGGVEKIPTSGTAVANTQMVAVGGKAVEMTAISLLDDNGGSYTYFKICDLGKALGFNVGYSAERGVCIESGKPYVG